MLVTCSKCSIIYNTDKPSVIEVFLIFILTTQQFILNCYILVKSAKRHNVFNFEKCADYYAHATPAMKHLMERSGLVIVDLNKAIENGFVTMNEDLAEQFRREQDD